MKNLLIAAITIGLVSCNEATPPKQIAQDFIKAVAGNDNSTASSLATSDTKVIVSATKNSTTEIINTEELFSLGTLNETINTDKAVVKNDIISLSLKKENDGWKVIATPELIGVIVTRQALLTAQKQKWEALLKEYEARIKISKEYVQYKKGAGPISPSLQKLDDVINALTVKTTWNKETIALYVQKQKQLADLIEKALEPSANANSDLSMNYIISLSDVNDRIKTAEEAYGVK